MTKSVLFGCLTRWILLGFIEVDAFTPVQKCGYARSGMTLPSQRFSGMKMLQFDDVGNSFAIAVETFDGSTVDPVVVSDVFWNGLKAKILSVIIGQILASIAFLIISTVAATQISNLGNFLSEKLSRGDDSANVSESAIKLLDQK